MSRKIIACVFISSYCHGTPMQYIPRYLSKEINSYIHYHPNNPIIPAQIPTPLTASSTTPSITADHSYIPSTAPINTPISSAHSSTPITSPLTAESYCNYLYSRNYFQDSILPTGLDILNRYITYIKLLLYNFNLFFEN